MSAIFYLKKKKSGYQPRYSPASYSNATAPGDEVASDNAVSFNIIAGNTQVQAK